MGAEGGSKHRGGGGGNADRKRKRAKYLPHVCQSITRPCFFSHFVFEVVPIEGEFFLGCIMECTERG